MRIVVGEVCEVCGGWVCRIVMIGVGIVGVKFGVIVFVCLLDFIVIFVVIG